MCPPYTELRIVLGTPSEDTITGVGNQKVRNKFGFYATQDPFDRGTGPNLHSVVADTHTHTVWETTPGR